MRQPVPFGKYLLLDRISVGGMAEVFKAKSYGVEGFEKVIAIKRILPSMGEDKDFIRMFIDEAKIAGQLSHANICQIFELGRIQGAHFIAMEYVWGKDLLQIQNRYRKMKQVMPVQMACYAVAKVCEGLHYAHRKRDALGRPLQIVHRDCSPQNILISYEGEVKIIDFGIARAASRSSRTNAGVLKGKFGYMSPEQVRGLPLDHRSDIFSVGIILYESLTGSRLFLGESDFSTLEKVRNADVRPPRHVRDEIPSEVEDVVMKALARHPNERYQSCAEMHDDLKRYLTAQEKVFTQKNLGEWVKKAFSTELAREKELMERYKRVGRDGLIAGKPQAEAKLEVEAELGEAPELEGDPTMLGGPDFDDVEDASGARTEEASPAGPDKAEGHPRGKVVRSGSAADEDDDDFDEGPTEIFGEIASDQVAAVRDLLPAAAQQAAQAPEGASEEAPERGSNKIVVGNKESGPPSPPGSPAQPPSQQPPAPPAAFGSGGPPPAGPQGPSPPAGPAGSPHGFPQPPSFPSPGAGMYSPYPPPPSAGSGPYGAIAPPAVGSGPFPPTAQVSFGSSPGRSALPSNATMPIRRRSKGRGGLAKDIGIGVGIAALVLGLFAAGKYFLLGEDPGPNQALADNATLAVVVDGEEPAEVLVDGEKVGMVDGADTLKLELEPRDYQVEVRRGGGEPCDQRVELEASQVEVVRCSFAEAAAEPATLVLEGIAEDHHVFLDDEEVSPKVAREALKLEAGKEHEVRVEQGGEVVDELSLRLEPGEEKTHEIVSGAEEEEEEAEDEEGEEQAADEEGRAGGAAVARRGGAERRDRRRARRRQREEPEEKAPKVGWLIAYTTPWARVHIDGKDTGTSTPIPKNSKIPLEPGPHKVTFVVDDEQFSYPITITAGKIKKIVRDLQVRR